MADSILKIDNISLAFGGVKALTDVSFEVKKGSVFSIIGPNGAGKTSMLNCISGRYRPNSGSIEFNGRDVTKLRPNDRADLGMGRTFQNLALFPLMTVADNISFSLEVRGINKIKRRERADELLELIELSGQGDKKVHELSGGQRQRVAIARALAIEPESPEDIRDKGILEQRLLNSEKALEYLNKYLEINPNAEDVDFVLELIRSMKKND